MRKSINTIISLAVFAFISILMSCSLSTEEKAKRLSENKIKETLIIPESYDLASIELDSAFAPYDEPEFYDLTIEFAKDCVAIAEAQNDKQHARSSIALWGGPYQSSYDRVEQSNAREKFRKAKKTESDAIDHAKDIAEQMKEMFSKEPSFIGLKAKVKYRAKTNEGDIEMSTVKVLFDKDMTKVIDIYDMDSEEYQAFIAVCNEIEKKGQQ